MNHGKANWEEGRIIQLEKTVTLGAIQIKDLDTLEELRGALWVGSWVIKGCSGGEDGRSVASDETEKVS